jgi:hypothetical protein
MLSSILHAQVESGLIPVPAEKNSSGKIIFRTLPAVSFHKNNEYSGKYLKSSLLTKRKLDNIEYFMADSTSRLRKYKEHEFTYDEKGREILDIEYSLNENNRLTQSKKTQKEYDEDNNLIRITRFIYNINHWKYSSKQEFSYDTLKNITDNVKYIWNGSSWSKHLWKKNEYNEKSLITKKERFIWDQIENKWLPDTVIEFDKYILETYPKLTYSYFENGKQDNEYVYMWNTGLSEWYTRYKRIGHMVDETHYYYREYRKYDWQANPDLTFESTVYYTYDFVNSIEYLKNLISKDSVDKEFFEWNMDIDNIGNLLQYTGKTKFGDEWKIIYHDERQYNEDHDLIKDKFTWDETISMSNPFGHGRFQKEYSYTEYRDVETYYNKEWDKENHRWKNNEKYEYTYDENDTVTDLVLPEEYYNTLSELYISEFNGQLFKDIDLLRHKVLTRDKYIYIDSIHSWKISERTIFNYSDFIMQSVTDKKELTEINVYPNPVNDILQIEFRESEYILSLFDITGKLLYRLNAEGSNTQIDLTKYRQGMYILKITDAKTQKYKNIKVVKL